MKTISELNKAIVDELFYDAPRSMTTKKARKARSLLPFVGTALKSLFGVSTERDMDILDERISQVERWAEKQGAIFNTVINAANANAKDIKSVVTFMNELSREVQNLALSAQQQQRFSLLAMDSLRHISLHKERVQAY